MPLFIFLFLALAIGMIVGSLATWVKQGRYRKLARQRGVEAENLRQAVSRAPAAPQGPAPAEADDLKPSGVLLSTEFLMLTISAAEVDARADLSRTGRDVARRLS